MTGNRIVFGEQVQGYIVASSSLDKRIDLEEASAMLGNAIFEPDQFPFVIYRINNPKVIIHLFASGKLVCSGAKNKEDIYRAIQQLQVLLEEKALIG
jgi:transcription initiation factor TFIID TATA-box-binding protein